MPSPGKRQDPKEIGKLMVSNLEKETEGGSLKQSLFEFGVENKPQERYFCLVEFGRETRFTNKFLQ